MSGGGLGPDLKPKRIPKERLPRRREVGRAQKGPPESLYAGNPDGTVLRGVSGPGHVL